MATVYTPVEGFTGTVAGVEFEDGKGKTDDDRALAYFRRAGYGIGKRPQSEDPPEPPDPRKVGNVAGPELRDAAVDPRPDDFLPPINAGKANPHGPEVVSPEIHASQGVRPVKGGEVHVDDASEQDSAERAHAVAVLNDGPAAAEAQSIGDDDAPAVSANKPEWESYARSKGVDVKGLTKDQIIDKVGGRS